MELLMNRHTKVQLDINSLDPTIPFSSNPPDALKPMPIKMRNLSLLPSSAFRSEPLLLKSRSPLAWPPSPAAWKA